MWCQRCNMCAIMSGGNCCTHARFREPACCRAGREKPGEEWLLVHRTCPLRGRVAEDWTRAATREAGSGHRSVSTTRAAGAAQQPAARARPAQPRSLCPRAATGPTRGPLRTATHGVCLSKSQMPLQGDLHTYAQPSCEVSDAAFTVAQASQLPCRLYQRQ